MNLILLAGNSIHSKNWIEELESKLKNLFQSTNVQYYKHWATGEPIADIEHEISVLSEKVKDLKNYIILAKSVGTYITIKAIKEGKIKPTKCIFLGFPYKWLREKGFGKEIDNAIKSLNVPSLFIQNSLDHYCSYEELNDFLKKNKVKYCQTFEFLNNDTHDYEDYSKLKEIVKNFIN